MYMNYVVESFELLYTFMYDIYVCIMYNYDKLSLYLIKKLVPSNKIS